MARFSRMLTASLMNPQFGQGMFGAGNAAGQLGAYKALQNIQPELEAQRQAKQQGLATIKNMAETNQPAEAIRAAEEALRRQGVKQADVNKAVEQGQSMYYKRESMRRAKEQEKRNIENFKIQQWRHANEQNAEKLRKTAEQVSSGVWSMVNTSKLPPEAVDKVIDGLPTELQSVARDTQAKAVEVRTERESLMEQNEPLSEKFLDNAAKILPPEAIENYKEQSKTAEGHRVAKQRLLKLYDTAMANQTRTSTAQIKPTNPTENELDIAREAIDTAVGGILGVGQNMEIPAEDMEALVRKVAVAARTDPEALRGQNIKTMWEEMKGENKDEELRMSRETGELGSQENPYSVTDKESYDKVKSGEFFMTPTGELKQKQ